MSSDRDAAERSPLEGASDSSEQAAEVTRPSSVNAAAVSGAALQRVEQHLHWSSLFFDIVGRFREYLIPLILAFLSARNQDWFFGIMAGIFLIGSLLHTLIRYFTLRFGIFDGELVVKQGLLFRSVRTVPTRKIQNVNLRQNLFHRMLGVYEVHVETASGQEAEAVLRVLAKSQIDKLRAEIAASRQQATNQADLKMLPDASVAAGSSLDSFQVEYAGDVDQRLTGNTASGHEQMILTIPANALIKVGLASNRGWLVVGVVMGLIFQFGSFDDERWLKQVWRVIRDGLESLHLGWAQYVILILIALLLLKLFGIVWYLTRFYGYELTRCGDDLRVKCGLLTSYSATVPRKRIQVISVQSSWLMRRLDVARISIETAGGGGQGDEGEHGHTRIARSSFIPAIPIDDVPRVLAELRPGLAWDADRLVALRVAPGATRRLIRLRLAMIVVLTATAAWLAWPYGLLVILALGPLAIWWARRFAASLEYVRTNYGICFRSGVLTKKTSFAFLDRVQTLSLTQTPFDRRWKMATLMVDTAAAGPAEHPLQIPYLDAQAAAVELRTLRKLAAEAQPQWA